MTRSMRISFFIFYGLLFLLSITSVSLLIFSFSEFSTIRSYVDSLSTDHIVESFTNSYFHSIVWKARIAAVILLIVAVLSFFVRKKIMNILAQLFSDAFHFSVSFFARLKYSIEQENRFHLTTLLIIFISGFLIKLYHLFQPISYDEAFTYLYFVNRPLLIGLCDYSYPNNHLFHTFLSHISCSLFGNSLWAIRLPAFLTGVLIVPAAYVTGRKLVGKHAALFGSSFIASANTISEHSVMARGYTLITLFFLLILFLASELKNENKKGAWLFFVLFAVLGLYTIPVFLYALLPVLLWMFINSAESKKLRKEIFYSFIFIGAIAFTLYIPPILASGIRSVLANDYIKSDTNISLINQFPPFLISLVKIWIRGIPFAFTCFLAAGFLISFFSPTGKQSSSIVASIHLVLVTMIFIQQRIPPERTWIYLLPLFLLLSSSGIIFLLQKLFRKNISLPISILSLVVVIFLGLNVYSLKPLHWGEICDNEKIATVLKAKLQAGDKVLAGIPIDYPLEYYFRQKNIPTDYMRVQSENFSRLFIIVNEASKQKLEELIPENYFKGSALSAATIICKFDSTQVFEVQKK